MFVDAADVPSFALDVLMRMVELLSLPLLNGCGIGGWVPRL
jgi:hypothetical protein